MSRGSGLRRQIHFRDLLFAWRKPQAYQRSPSRNRYGHTIRVSKSFSALPEQKSGTCGVLLSTLGAGNALWCCWVRTDVVLVPFQLLLQQTLGNKLRKTASWRLQPPNFHFNWFKMLMRHGGTSQFIKTVAADRRRNNPRGCGVTTAMRMSASPRHR